jgi:hypothetical protein
MGVNNVCFCKCHSVGKVRCQKCATLHLAKEKPVTHENDKTNPSYSKDKVASA